MQSRGIEMHKAKYYAGDSHQENCETKYQPGFPVSFKGVSVKNNQNYVKNKYSELKGKN
jgi:hypothetical protein